MWRSGTVEHGDAIVGASAEGWARSMNRAALVVLLVLALGTGCGGKSNEPGSGPPTSPCGPPTLSNCPQDTLTDAGECPLPPLIDVQALYTVGCQVTATCPLGMQMCVCNEGPSGPNWGCTF